MMNRNSGIEPFPSVFTLRDLLAISEHPAPQRLLAWFLRWCRRGTQCATGRMLIYEPVRHPTRPSLLLTECSLRATTSPRGGFPCSDDFLFHACRRHYPGGIVGCCRYLAQRQRPSLKTRQVGFRNFLFEAGHRPKGGPAFTHVSVCMVAKSPTREPLLTRLAEMRSEPSARSRPVPAPVSLSHP